MDISLDYATLAFIYPTAEQLHAQNRVLWRNDKLLYKIRTFIYGPAEKEYGLDLTSYELSELARWMYEAKHIGEKENFCFKKLKLILYLHCHKEIKAFERDIETLEKIKQRS